MSDLSFDTKTMAELYFKQGHYAQAADVYKKLLRAYPDDEQLRLRLSEIESVLAPQRGLSMSFREHIQRIVDATPGAVACTIMGFDGIAVDTVEADTTGVDVANLLVEYSTAAQQLHRHAAQSAVGSFVEMVVRGEQMSAVLRPLTEEYFLAVILPPSAIVGKARFLMRVACGPITKELS